MALINENFDTWMGIACPVYAVIDKITLNKKENFCWYDLDIYGSHTFRDDNIWPITTIYFEIGWDEFLERIRPIITQNGNVCVAIYEDCKTKLWENWKDDI